LNLFKDSSLAVRRIGRIGATEAHY